MRNVLRWTAFYGCALLATLWLVGMSWAEGIPRGVGGNPSPGPYEFDDNYEAHVGPASITIDPDADPWIKQFVIPPNAPLDPAIPYSIHEEIYIFPSGDHPNQAITDWHEHIHEPVDPAILPPGSLTWGSGRLVIHDPDDPTGTPLVDVPGHVDPTDPQGIWFEFPAVPIPPIGTVLPVWIWKEIVYNGPPVTGLPITVDVWEYPTVPEPGSLVLAGLGCLALAGFARRRRS